VKKTPLESWIRSKVRPGGNGPLTRQDLETCQLEKLRQVVSCARRESPFYRDLLSGVGDGVKDLEAFAGLPFTTPRHVREQGLKMLCAPLDEIERVVTLQTSGTTGEAKRVFFTAEDLESTVDFFGHGMTTMVEAGATVIIFLPGERPNSVGDLLAKALARMGVKPVIHGPVRDPSAAREEIRRHPAPCLVGIPTQILSLARGDVEGMIPTGWVDSVLLSTDYVSTAITEELERLWGCRVFAHYGLTETGLGGGVECEAREGYHLREADLYTEIVDPVTGQRVEEGRSGEVVFTTLARRGMPLIRYRTGDLASMLPSPCPCGTVLKRLGRVQGRIEAEIALRGGARLAMAALDEALFPIDGVLNYTAEVSGTTGGDQLNLCFHVLDGKEERVAREAADALFRAEPVSQFFRQRMLTVGGITFSDADWFTTGTGKRRITDSRPPAGPPVSTSLDPASGQKSSTNITQLAPSSSTN
jgi:phenylacetate-CoA ligase